jgi:hypothetical protein
MKILSVKSVFALCVPLILSACSVNPSGQTKVVPIAVTKTIEPEIQIQTATLRPSNTPNPNIIYSSSPDNKYTIELELAESPIKLTILNHSSKQKTQIPISYRYYNKIEEDSSKGFRWFTDNKVLMFVLYREPSAEKVVEDFSCFFAIDVQQAKLLTANFSSMSRHVWIPDKTGVVTIEHGGLNDIFDYYFPETNCYKSTLGSECEESNVLMDGTPPK